MNHLKRLVDQRIRRKYITIIGITLALVIVTSISFLIYMTNAQNTLDAERSELQEKVEAVDEITDTLN